MLMGKSMKEKMTEFGNCVGVAGYIKAHKYEDGNLHYEESHGLCLECSKMTMRIFEKEIEKYRSAALRKNGRIQVNIV